MKDYALWYDTFAFPIIKLLLLSMVRILNFMFPQACKPIHNLNKSFFLFLIRYLYLHTRSDLKTLLKKQYDCWGNRPEFAMV